ncbi:MAG: hypothetical protein WC220_12980 [Pedobacter sp.]|jgi:hypothetical protein
MKKLRLFVTTILILSALNAYSQVNSPFKIDVGGKSLLIPIPLNGFVESGDIKRIVAKDQVPEGYKLIAYFLPEDIAKHAGIEPSKKMFIGVNKEVESLLCSPSDFIDVKESLKTVFSSSGLLEVIKDANIEFKRTQDIVGKAEIGEMKTIGSILETSDAISFLTVTKYNFDEGSGRVIGSASCVRVKQKVLLIYVFNVLENEESINWVSTITKNWLNSILEINNEIEKEVPKPTSSNSYMNLLNTILGLFKDLITRTPITFILLVIVLILYYKITRKMFSNYIKTNKDQSYISLYIKAVHTDVHNKYNFARATFRLFEFLIVLVIFLSLLHMVGLPIPDGVF